MTRSDCNALLIENRADIVWMNLVHWVEACLRQRGYEVIGWK